MLPGTITEDFTGHQYDQQANQVKVSMEPRNWYNNGDRANLFGFEPNFGLLPGQHASGLAEAYKNAFFMKGQGGAGARRLYAGQRPVAA